MAKKPRSKKNSELFFQLPRVWKWRIGAAIFLILLLWSSWKIIGQDNTRFRASHYYFYVRSGMEADQAAEILEERKIIYSAWSVKLYAKIFNIVGLKPGLYRIEEGSGNYGIMRSLHAIPIRDLQRLEVMPFRKRDNMISNLCRQAGVDEKEFLKLLKNEKFLKKRGYNPESVYCLFIPGQVMLEKPINAETLFEAVLDHYLFIWTDERLDMADRLGLEPHEVMILSSIVYSETKSIPEMPIVAGVYLNRLRIDMRLESDPTLVHANKAYGIQRLRDKHKRIDSPYNTYRKKGLPPGPVNTVPEWVIDPVLNAQDHQYLYFCAKPGGDGEHLFAENYAEHRKNARRYQNSLERKGIVR